MSPPAFELTARDGAYARKAWFRAGPPAPHHLGILLDGEHMLERVGALPIIERLTADGHIPPMSWLFIESGGPAARHADYTHDVRFARFVAEDAFAWAAERAALRDGRHLIGGLSLSGLAAAFIAVRHRERFAAALCQSGSFWFEPDAFAATVEAQPPRETRFWLSVGDEETDVDVRHPPSGMHQTMTQIAGVERARAALAPNAAAVHVHTYAGGHTFDPWRAELPDALRWLLAERGPT